MLVQHAATLLRARCVAAGPCYRPQGGSRWRISARSALHFLHARGYLYPAYPPGVASHTSMRPTRSRRLAAINHVRVLVRELRPRPDCGCFTVSSFLFLWSSLDRMATVLVFTLEVAFAQELSHNELSFSRRLLMEKILSCYYLDEPLDEEEMRFVMQTLGGPWARCKTGATALRQ